VEQVEVVAELIDSLIQKGACPAAEIGLLAPKDSFVHGTIREVFGQAGIATSGLPTVRRTRDLGREAIHLALRCLQDPSPPMALASLALLPLMPWGREEADRLADHAMGRVCLPGRVESFTDDGNRMLGLLRRRPDSLRSLIGTMKAIVGLLRPEPTPGHLESADGTVALVIEALAGRQEIPWAELLERTAPASIDVGGETSTDQEGVAVFSESREPWRPVRHLFLLGFNEGHFPGGIPVEPVFGAHGLNALAEAGLPVRIGADRREAGRRLLRRQLSIVSDSLTILVPACDLSGEALYPSETLGTMARLFQEQVEPEKLVRSIDRDEEIAALRGLSSLPPQAPVPPRPLVVEEPHLDRDLTRLRLDEDGRPKPESPSGLEKLLVSPLGWLLSRTGLEPATWSPPGFDVMLQGKLAHKVFEDLFTPGMPIPDDRELLERVPEVLKNALERQARHLDPNEVWMEFDNLEGTLKRAVTAWVAFLRTTGAQVVSNETWMHGALDDLPIRGLADTTLRLGDDQLLVVDFKKASVSKRRTQLERGFDLQTSLYRIMLTLGELSNLPPALQEIVGKGCPTGVAYFTLNDGRAVVAHLPTEAFPDADVEVVSGDPARESMPLLFERLRQVREGRVPFNRTGDEKWFNEQASITPYALDGSPLIRLYMLPEEVES
ncbi:MAG: PD-(D/E)XK nuclease family protein, partial [Pseudomonadota bacterium]